ncbi:MAG: hypothetical protein M0Z27_00075 [Thermaerobacter sp.]|nr:hypothetical protein [Thermaerobacter sp.]
MTLEEPEAFGVVVAGSAAVVAVFGVAIFHYNTNAHDVVTVVGAATGVVGTIVGAFFGVKLGASGEKDAEQKRDQAEAKALRYAELLPPETFRQAEAGGQAKVREEVKAR